MVAHTVTTVASDQPSKEEPTSIAEEKAKEEAKEVPIDEGAAETAPTPTSMVAHTVSNEGEKIDGAESVVQDEKEAVPVAEEPAKSEEATAPTEPKEGEVEVKVEEKLFLTEVESKPTDEQAQESPVQDNSPSTEQTPEASAPEPADTCTSMVAHTVSSVEEKTKESESGQVSMVAHTVSNSDTTKTPPPSPAGDQVVEEVKSVQISDLEKAEAAVEGLISEAPPAGVSGNQTSMVAHTVTSEPEQSQEKPKEGWKEDAFNEMNKNSCLQDVIPVSKSEEPKKPEEVKEEQKPETASPVAPDESKPTEEPKPQESWKEDAINEMNKNACLQEVIPGKRKHA